MTPTGHTHTTPTAPPLPVSGPIVFTGCDMQTAAAAAHDHGSGHAHAHPRRREVVVNGKRIKTIDVHAHCCVPEATAVIGHPLEAPGLLDGRHLHAHRGDGRAGHRRRGAQHQSLLVQGRQATQSAELIQHPERDAGRILRRQPRPLRRLRDGGAAASRSRRRAGRTRRQEARLPRRRRRRQRRRRGTRQSALPSVLGEVRGARRAGVHASARHARTGAERAPGRQRPADQHDRQSAGDHDRAVAPDLRGHARPLPRAQDLRRARRRLPAVLRQPLRRGAAAPSPTASVRCPKKKPTAYLARRPALLRHDRVHARSAAPSDRRDRVRTRS